MVEGACLAQRSAAVGDPARPLAAGQPKAGRCRLYRGGGRWSVAIASTIATRGPRPHNRAVERAAGRGPRGRQARERGARGTGRAKLVEPPPELHPDVLAALERLEVSRLYSHQARRSTSAWSGPTIITTGTASGKSMCFNLPTLDVLCRDARARALYVYPTKALAQDQARALAAFGLTKRVRPAIYDGDTPREARAEIRRSANVVLTNPDMLHVGILPNHAAWAELFANLAVVVIDEAHVYRGVFGSHVANVLRRLRRIAAAYGTEPRFLLTSATIANPVELAERLTGLEEVSLIDEDGSPAPVRRIAVWNPPLTDTRAGRAPLGARRGGGAAGAARARRRAHDLLHEVAQGRRAAEPVGQGGPRGHAPRAGRARRALPRRLHRPAAARARGPPHARGAARGDHHRRPRARHRRRRAGRGGGRHLPRHRRLAAPDVGTRRALDRAAGAAWPCTWRARMRSTSSSPATPRSSSTDPSRPRSSTTRALSSSAAHLLCAAHEGPLSHDDAEFLGPRWEAHAELLLSAG